MSNFDDGPKGPENNIPEKKGQKDQNNQVEKGNKPELKEETGKGTEKDIEKDKVADQEKSTEKPSKPETSKQKEKFDKIEKEQISSKESVELIKANLEKLEEDKQKLDQTFDAVGSELAQFEHWDGEEKFLVDNILGENSHNYSEYESVIQDAIDQANSIIEKEETDISGKNISNIVKSQQEILTQLNSYKNKLQNISQTLAKIKETLPDSSFQENSKNEYKQVVKNYSAAVSDFILDGIESVYIVEESEEGEGESEKKQTKFIDDSFLVKNDEKGESGVGELSDAFADAEKKLQTIKAESKKEDVDLEDFSETMSENSIQISPEMKETFMVKKYFEMHPGLKDKIDKQIKILDNFQKKLKEDIQNKYSKGVIKKKFVNLDNYNDGNLRQVIKEKILNNVDSNELLEMLEGKEDELINLKAEIFPPKEEKLKGWTADVMECVEALGKNKFTLNEMYDFKSKLSKKHPKNRTIRSKIRQQLQVLRDKGYLEFLSPGNYRLIKTMDNKKPEVEESDVVSGSMEVKDLEEGNISKAEETVLVSDSQDVENLEEGDVSEVEESKLVSGSMEVKDLEEDKTEGIENLDLSGLEEIPVEEYEEHFWEGAENLQSDYQSYIDNLEDLTNKVEGDVGEKIKRVINTTKDYVSDYIEDKYATSSDEAIKSHLIDYINNQKQGLKKLVDNLEAKGLLQGEDQEKDLETQTLVNEGIAKGGQAEKPRETVLDGSKIPPKPDLQSKKEKEVTEMSSEEKLNEFWDNNEELEEDIENTIDGYTEKIKAQLGDKTSEDLLGEDLDDWEENIFDNIREYIINNYGQIDDKAIADWMQKYIKTRFENTKDLIFDAQENLSDEGDAVELSPEGATEVFWDGNEVLQAKFSDTLDRINSIRNSLISDGLIESSQLDDWQSIITERVDNYLNKYGNEQSEKELETWVKGYLSSTLDNVKRFNELLRDGKISGEDFTGIISGEKEVEDLDYNVDMPKESIEVGEQLSPRDREKIEGIKAAIGAQPDSLDFLQDYLEEQGIDVGSDEIMDNLGDKDFRKLVEQGLNKYRNTETLSPRDREKIEGIKAAIGAQPDSLDFLQDYLEEQGIEVGSDEIMDNLGDKDFRKLVEQGLNKYRQENKNEGITARDKVATNDVERDFFKRGEELENPESDMEEEKGETSGLENLQVPIEKADSGIEKGVSSEELKANMMKAEQFAKLYEIQLSQVDSEIALIEARIQEIQNTDVDVARLDADESYLKEHGERSAELTNLYERLRKLDIKKKRLENLSLKYKSDFELYKTKQTLGELAQNKNIEFTEEERRTLQDMGLEVSGDMQEDVEEEERNDSIAALNKAIASVKAKQPVVSTDEADFIRKKESSGLGELGEVVPADELDFEEEKLEEISIRDFPVRERRQLRNLAVDENLDLNNDILEIYQGLRDNKNEILETFLETVEDDTQEELEAKTFTYTNNEGAKVNVPADILVKLNNIAQGV